MSARKRDRASVTPRGRTVARVLPACLAVAAAVLLVAVAAEAGWQRQRMNLQDENKGFIDVCAVSADFAIAPGVVKSGGSEGGAIFATRDGSTWSPVTPPTSGGMMDIHIYTSCWFEDQEHGYVGALGELWVTDDSAATWTKVALGGLMGGKTVSDLHGLRGGPAWAALTNGDLLRTDDGGGTWPVIGQPLGEAELSRVVFVDDQHGWVGSGAESTDEESGEVTGYSEGGLALTTDGGESWETVFSSEPRKVLSLRFLDRSRGFMVSKAMTGSRLERTVDGGVSWEPMATPSEATVGAVASISDVYFFDGCEGWLLGSAGNNGSGILWKTRDGGQSWIEEEDREFLTLGKILGFPVESGLHRFDFVSRNVGYASGTYETLYRYDADDEAPDCDDPGPADGGPGGDDGGGRCQCRAAAGPEEAAPVALLVLFTSLAARIARRRWTS